MCKIAVEKTALLAKVESLKLKHTLEKQKAELQTKMETLELKIDLAATDVKWKVLELYETQSNMESMQTHH